MQVLRENTKTEWLPRTAAVMLFLAFFLPHLSHAQTTEIPLVDSHSTDPFKISAGSSFSASSGKGERHIAERRTSSPTDLLLNDIASSLRIIEQHHAGTAVLSMDKASSSSIRQMLRSLDPHSTYYDPAQFAALIGEHRSEYFGTGLTISTFKINGRLETFVLYTTPGSSAGKAGLEFGDRLVSVNGEPVSGLDVLRVREMIRGPQGTDVVLKISRADDLSERTVSLRRERLPQKTIPHSFILADGIGYIEISVGFSYTTVTELDKALSELKLRGMRSLILDLRGNSGGIVDQAVTVAERFLPRGTEILTQRGRYTIDDRVWRSQNQSPEAIPLVLIVDGSTASAAEILAGALQDNDRALIVGERTFGKGLVQNVIELTDGSGMALTAARYFTPSGRSIQRNYSDIGLYDYFRKTENATLIAESREVRTTPTNRRVFGGNGIEPDVAVGQIEVTDKMVNISDLAFLFARDLAHGRIAGVAGPEVLRHRVIFGNHLIDTQIIDAFLLFARKENSVHNTNGKAIEEEFARSQLRYYLQLALFGNEAAAKALAQNDPQVAAAIATIGAAGRLAAEASRSRTRQAEKKGPLPSHRGGPN